MKSLGVEVYVGVGVCAGGVLLVQSVYLCSKPVDLPRADVHFA